MQRLPVLGRFEPRELDPNYQYAGALTALFDFQSEAVPINQVNGDRITVTGSGGIVRTSVGTKGIGTQFGATDGGTYFSFPIGTESVSSACYVWCGQIPATGGTEAIWRDNSTVNKTIPVFRSGGGFDMRLGDTDFTSAGTWSYATDYTVVVNVIGGVSSTMYVNGGVMIAGGAPGAGGLLDPWIIHRNGGNAQGCIAISKIIAVFDTPLPAAEALALSLDPARLFRPIRRFVFPVQPVGGGGSSVTLTPAAGTIVWNGQLATIKTRVNLSPSVGNVAWNGQVAALKTQINIAPSVGNVAWNGGVPTYSYQRTTLTPLAGTVTWNGGVPTLKTLQRISPFAGNIAWNGQVATLATRVSVTLQPVAGNIAWNGGVPAQKLRINVSPAAGAVSWAGGVSTLSFPANFEWTPVTRASTSWTKIARTTATWTRIDRTSTTWTKRQFPYDDEV